MFDINSIIGLEVSVAINKLNDYGIKNIKVIDNFKHNELCDTKLVCAAKNVNDSITLICGEFYLDLKEK